MALLRCSTVSPNRLRLNRSASPSSSRMRCKALRAAWMLSPFIEPLQSTRIFMATGRGSRAGSLGVKLAMTTPSPWSSRSQAARPRLAWGSWSKTSTKSRSSHAWAARLTSVMNDSLVPTAGMVRMATLWVGEPIWAWTSSP